MNQQSVIEIMQTNPEAAEQARQRMEGVLVRSATDPAFRAQLLSEPRAALSSYFGAELPELDIVFIENQANTATIVLPDFVDVSAELSDSDLEAVAGGSEPFTLTAAAAIGLVAGGIAIGSALTVIGYAIVN
ncbi:MAG TPA: hypothetical protein VF665_03055 [Longimicrobium sp.]|jgi:hypothetical protein|uniref:hypothetical protein n=1 Tax=Longimicrobium sp. TaxID=2029185 RepID=UPI002ED780E9